MKFVGLIIIAFSYLSKKLSAFGHPGMLRFWYINVESKKVSTLKIISEKEINKKSRFQLVPFFRQERVKGHGRLTRSEKGIFL